MSVARQCGGCTLCCKLLPTQPLNKPANTRCQHQRTGKGCAIYEKRPNCCRLWSCAWLIDPETRDLSRPDRARYVIDIVPEFFTVRQDDTGETRQIPALQVWLDPADRDAWQQDEALLAYLARRGEQGMAAIMRLSAVEAFAVFPPALASDGKWHVSKSQTAEVTHTAADVAKVLEASGVRVSYELAEV